MSHTSPVTVLTAPSAGGSSEIATFSGRIANHAASPFAASSAWSTSTTAPVPAHSIRIVPVEGRGDPPLEQVDVADEVGDVARVRLLVDLGRRRHLDDPAVVHHRDPVGDGHRLLLVVGDDDEGEAELLLEVDQLELRLLAELLVERAERLVEEEHLRLLGERAGERHALLLAAGELVGLPLGEGRRA